MSANERRTNAFFYRVTSRPRLVLIVTLLLVVAAASGLTRLVKDTSVKAFIPDNHPALVADNKVAEIFGLSDTVAIAVATEGDTVFSPAVLDVVASLTEEIAAVANIRADRVISLATESTIAGADGEIQVAPYINSLPVSHAGAADARARWQAMPPHIGTLVSANERSTIILAELVSADLAAETYDTILQLGIEHSGAGIDVYVAGPGAVSGFLSSYIDQDARKLQPLVFLLVLGFIFLAFRRLSALPGPLLVVLGATGGSLGLMAWNGVPYYAITNALPVIIVAISVADAIHILSAYFQLRSQFPDSSTRDLVVRAMSTMARPITVTTLTTIAGFVGIGAASIMPPVAAFAWYAAFGVFLAWLLSVFALPNMLILLRLGPSPAFRNWEHNKPSGVGRHLANVGSFSAAHWPFVLGISVLCASVATVGALRLEVDRSQVENFAPDEPIRIADEFINDTFAGTAFLDIVIESTVDQGLLDPARMQKIADLQSFLENLPHVSTSVAITDYISLLHHAVEEKPPVAAQGRLLPDGPDSIAQYLFLYEVSGDPADFEEEIDYDYQAALVRGILNSQYFSESRKTVEALQNYLNASFNDATMHATLAGDVTIGYHWMSRLERSHFLGVGLSLVLVLASSIVAFRSVSAGVFAVIPVSFAVLTLYAVMGFNGIYLEPATSMFAAIALGVGVDFGIHLVEHLNQARAIHAANTAAAVEEALPPTARACFFNSAALGLGFSVLLFSNLPTLQRFGGLVTVAAVSSYAAALVVVPALFAMENAVWQRFGKPALRTANGVLVVVIVVLGTVLAGSSARAEDNRALEVAHRVADRAEGQAMTRVIEMSLTNKRGRTRDRRALVHKRASDQTRFTRITYVAPKAIRGTSFLSHNHEKESRPDDRWLYMPSMRKTRRIPAADRGDYFLGTDFTYEDMQSELKFDLSDYTFEYNGNDVVDGKTRHVIGGRPVSNDVAEQLGYGAFVAVVDEESWLPLEIDFFDENEKPLKTVTVGSFENIDGNWTATEIAAVNHQTGHRTTFKFRDIVYMDDLDAQMFQPASLERGLQAMMAGVR